MDNGAYHKELSSILEAVDRALQTKSTYISLKRSEALDFIIDEWIKISGSRVKRWIAMTDKDCVISVSSVDCLTDALAKLELS